MPEIKKLVIPREKWGTGVLLDYDGKMCCLGHLAKACGYPDEAILNAPLPHTIRTAQGGDTKFPKAFQNSRLISDYSRTGEPAWASADWGLCAIASDINDSDELSRPEKERQLKVLFKSRGIELSFTGEPLGDARWRPEP